VVNCRDKRFAGYYLSLRDLNDPENTHLCARLDNGNPINYFFNSEIENDIDGLEDINSIESLNDLILSRDAALNSVPANAPINEKPENDSESANDSEVGGKESFIGTRMKKVSSF
jgi:hypothetical protein